MAKKESLKSDSTTQSDTYNPEEFQAALSKYSNVVDKNGKIKSYAFPLNKEGKVSYSGPIVQYLTPLTNSIKDYQSVLNQYMSDNKLNKLTADQANSALKAANKGDYSTYLNNLNDYNKLRDLTPLSRRNPNVEVGLTSVDPGDSNSGAVLHYGETAPYDSSHTELFAPYAKGGTIKAPKIKKGYANGTGIDGVPDISMLSESDQAIYNKLPPERQAEFLSTKTQDLNNDQAVSKVDSTVNDTGSILSKAGGSSAKVGAGLGWFGAANAGKDLGKSLIKRDKFGNPVSNTGDVADELLTPDHEQIINDVKNKKYGLALLDSTGLGKFGRALMKGTGNDNTTTGISGFINKNTGITDENKKRKEIKDLSQEANQDLAPEINRLKDGGEIKGKGTAKSDSIKAEVKKGSFVVPAENSDIAEILRETYFGNKSTKANLKQGDGIPVNLSNGEHLFSPKEKSYLEKIGIDLTKLAPNANENISKAKGGEIGGQGSDINLRADEGVYAFPGATDTTSSDKIGPVKSITAVPTLDTTKPVSSTNKDKASQDFDWLSLLGPAQTALGVASLLKDGKRPVDKLSADYLNGINTAKGAATYGFDLPTKTKYENAIESARVGNVGLAAQTAGGDAGIANANARSATNNYSKQMLGLLSEDAKLKQQKEQYLNSLLSDKQEKERRLFEDKLNAFNVNQETGAGLLQSGILSMQNNAKNKRYEDLILGLNNDNNAPIAIK
jgi:hypothetical protein